MSPTATAEEEKATNGEDLTDLNPKLAQNFYRLQFHISAASTKRTALCCRVTLSCNTAQNFGRRKTIHTKKGGGKIRMTPAMNDDSYRYGRKTTTHTTEGRGQPECFSKETTLMVLEERTPTATAGAEGTIMGERKPTATQEGEVRSA